MALRMNGSSSSRHGGWGNSTQLLATSGSQMAKRNPDYVREKIQASQLIDRLHKCAFGEISLTMTQLRAIEILLRKRLPDLAAAEIEIEQTQRYVVEIPPLLEVRTAD
jgi:hypothetical protein